MSFKEKTNNLYCYAETKSKQYNHYFTQKRQLNRELLMLLRFEKEIEVCI